MGRVRRIVLKTAIIMVLLMLLAIGAALAAPHLQSTDKISGAKLPTDCVSVRNKVTHRTELVDRCVVDTSMRVLERDGVREGLIEIQHMAKTHPLLKVQCHLAMHQIGQSYQRLERIAVSELPVDLPGSASWNASCPGGFIHGFMQSLVGDKGVSLDKLRELNDTVCVAMDEQNMKGCAHAVGHGASRAYDNRLYDASRFCETLAPKTRHDCLSGAVMELDLADARVRDREDYDKSLAENSSVDCADVPKAELGYCRRLRVKGTGLRATWGSAL